MRASNPPDKAAIARELEAARIAYHDLLVGLSEDAWHRRTRNPDMLVKELMWHMAWSMSWISRSVDDVRLGRRPLVNRLPGNFADPLRKLAMRWLARRATPKRAAQAYDVGHRDLLTKLSAMRDDQWQLATRRFGETRTVEWHFRQPTAHFAEHAADVRAVLDGSS